MTGSNQGEQVRAVDTRMLVNASDAIAGVGREIGGSAGGLDRAVPAMPDDRHGLVLLAVRLDEAREGFDRRLGEQLDVAGGRLANQACESAAADSGAPFAHLPLAGR